ncbi:conserved hypothetical protein [Vibrio nigripulchritudo POn4]|uniref:hypothetical protein n=1 Tax=Vibrio nigripulchritudo TaxID=28173 RepID=UPI0003B1B6BA|nr:hypothetical protein [Vibrio nigripulchritudo]CCN63550.1 conserved hypothetical protein [Vibrio nigripulchritudo POn4]
MGLSGKMNNLHSSEIERKIIQEREDEEKPIFRKYPITATSLLIPAIKEYGIPVRKLVFQDLGNETKALLYRVVIAAYNYAFFDEFASKSSKCLFSRTALSFVNWLNRSDINNRYSLLKDYEADCFDRRNNHGGQSELPSVKTLLTWVLDYDDSSTLSLSQNELQLLLALRATKVSPNVRKKHMSLASYFGALDWLREDDVGIGKELYQGLASPKLTVKSLKATASSILIEIYNAKLALIKFFKLCAFSVDVFEMPSKANARERRLFVGYTIYSILCHYHDLAEKIPNLRNALELVLLSNTKTKEKFDSVRKALISKEEMDKLFTKHKRKEGEFSNTFAAKTFQPSSDELLFSFPSMSQLLVASPLTVGKVEILMFSWLMASQAVQPSDIKKLSKLSFRRLKVGGRVTHIECEYFKGRANSVYRTRSISTKTFEAQAILIFLDQHSTNTLSSLISDNPAVYKGLRSIAGVLRVLLELPWMKDKLLLVHKQAGNVPTMIPAALRTLISNGQSLQTILSYHQTSLEERRVFLSQSRTRCHTHMFGLQAIKNSAVHAYSDPYTLRYLINYNSHTNKTEKTHYLNADNEEWINATGRVTRTVMLDLINNVFDVGFTDNDGVNKAFNNEFASVADVISSKKAEMLSRFRLITDQEKGVINEVGILSISQKNQKELTSIYVLDSPVTAFKMLNYIQEFQENYKKLLSRNPDYLFKTVFPTVEWMEHVLTILSKPAYQGGKRIFKQMRESGVSASVFHSI